MFELRVPDSYTYKRGWVFGTHPRRSAVGVELFGSLDQLYVVFTAPDGYAISDYSDRLDRPLGDHIVTDIIPRLPRGRETSALNLGQIDRVFPLGIVPEWIAGRLFYALVTQAVRWLLLPLLVAYVGYETIAFFVGQGVRAINSLFVHLAYDVLWLFAAFGVFFALAWRMANRAVQAARPQVVEAEIIRTRLQRGERPPLGESVSGDISIFVSGHTHAPELADFATPQGGQGFTINSGCWLRQLQRLRAHFRVPPWIGS